MAHNLFNSLQTFTTAAGKTGRFYALPQLEKAGVGPVSRLPVSIRIVLESVLRNYDGQKITEEDVRTLANWRPTETRTAEIPFVVARIILQDFTGVPLLVDLAAMRSAVAKLGKDPKLIRTPGTRGPGGRPLDSGRSLRGWECFTTEYGDRIRAQSAPVSIPEMGHAGVR